MFDVQELLDDLGYSDWDGDYDMLICPCGYAIELDGRCPDGCVSPLLLIGAI